MLKAALDCLRSGLSIIPIDWRDKHPAGWLLPRDEQGKANLQSLPGDHRGRSHRPALVRELGREELGGDWRRLESAIALLSVTAAMLLDLRQAGRSEQAERTPATALVPVLWVQVLSGWRY